MVETKYLVEMSVRAGVHENPWGHIDYTVTVMPLVNWIRKYMPYVLIVAIVGGTIFMAASCKGSTVAFSNSSRVATLNIEIADSPSEMAKGLMGREALGENSGMLFDFKTDTGTSFYMKDTTIPLSIAFIDSSGKVLGVRDMKPLDLTPIEPPAHYRYAIEVNQGWFTRNSIKPGYRATIDY